MRHLAVIASLLVFVGAACPSGRSELQLPAQPPASVPAMQAPAQPDPAVAPGLKPYYVAYSAGAVTAALAEGRPVLLYFYAAWCPICREEDPKLKSAVEASATSVAAFRVDYDAESALKKEYRIPYQHHTVILRPDGTESTRFAGPIDAATLESALVAASR